MKILNSFRSLTILSTVLGASSSLLLASDQLMVEPSAKMAKSDQMFVEKAAEDGMTEVKVGQVASENASSPDLKSFGAKMVTEHSSANAELASIAAAEGVTVPADLTPKFQGMYDRLKSKTGASFDSSYITYAVKGHKSAAALFETEIETTKDPQLKAFAQKTLPVVKEHLAMIEKCQSMMSSKSVTMAK